MKNMNTFILATLTTLAAIFVTGCHGSDSTSCRTSDDCFTGELCRYDRCVMVVSSGTPTTHDRSEDEATPPAARITRPAPTTTTPAETETETEPSQTSPGATTPMAEERVSEDDPEQEERPWPDEPVIPREATETEVENTSTMATDAGCAGMAPLPGELVINEVLVNVPADQAGDANGDGVRDAYEDEFVEIVNISTVPLSLAGVSVANGDRPKYTFGPAECLMPLQARVVFGGPKGAPGELWGDVPVDRAEARFGFSNSAGSVQLLAASGMPLFVFVYEDPPLSSYVLSPELIGEHFIDHATLGAPFSPSTCTDGASLALGCSASN